MHWNLFANDLLHGWNWCNWMNPFFLQYTHTLNIERIQKQWEKLVYNNQEKKRKGKNWNRLMNFHDWRSERERKKECVCLTSIIMMHAAQKLNTLGWLIHPFNTMYHCIKCHQCDFISFYLLLDVCLATQTLFPTPLFSIYFRFFHWVVWLPFFSSKTSFEPTRNIYSLHCT